MVGWLQAVPDDHRHVPARLKAYLTEKENVVRSQRDHPACLALPMALLFGGLGLVVAASRESGADGARLLWQAWLILFGWVVFKFWDWSRRWFIVTDKRIIRASGTFRISIAQLMIALGRDITVQQNLIGEWLRFATFKVESAKDDHPMETVHWLAEPDELYRAISKTVQRSAGGGGGAVATMIGGDADGGGVVVIDEASRNPTQQIPIVEDEVPSRRARNPFRQRRQNTDPGIIIVDGGPQAHARERAVQDFGYSDTPARSSRRRLGLVENPGLFRRRR